MLGSKARIAFASTIAFSRRGRSFIDVGARAAVRGIQGLFEVEHFDNSTMMDVDFLPEHLLIVGGSYVGLEFAQMYRRFGSRVTVIEMGPRLIGREDEDVSAELQAILEREGVEFRLELDMPACCTRWGRCARAHELRRP